LPEEARVIHLVDVIGAGPNMLASTVPLTVALLFLPARVPL
jgi:hypothetical protein